VDFSRVNRESRTYVQTLDGVASQGEHPLVSPEIGLVSVASIDGQELDLSLRGVTEAAPGVLTQVRLLRGSWPGAGHQVAVGQVASVKLDLDIGDTLEFEGERWTVAGIIAAGGRVYDQEVWTDLDDLAAASNRTAYTNYTVRAQSAEAATALVETINENRRFPLRAQLACDFYARTGGMSIWMATLGQFIALIIAIGAAFGGMNTMYSAVAGRRREIGVLRALGFGRPAVLFAFLAESLAICLVGGILGIVLGAGLSLVPIDIPFLPASRVSLGQAQVLGSLILALMVGILGGGLPALQAARIPVVDALR
jgi:putative ABC transport system permease protein